LRTSLLLFPEKLYNWLVHSHRSDTYDLLTRGDTLGVFQFDGSGYRALCRLMRPDKFADITALGALYRPGPMGPTPT